jgi:hypothetical protein
MVFGVIVPVSGFTGKVTEQLKADVSINGSVQGAIARERRPV